MDDQTLKQEYLNFLDIEFESASAFRYSETPMFRLTKRQKEMFAKQVGISTGEVGKRLNKIF